MGVLKVYDGSDYVEVPNLLAPNAVTAGAVIADNAIVRGDGGVRAVQDSSPTIADNGVVSIPGIGDGGLTSYDLKVGDTATPDYGMVQIGDAVIGRTSFNAADINLDGAMLYRNKGGPVTGEIEHIFTESTGNTCRLALPKSAVGNATYNPRSMLLAGPAPADTDFVKVSYWQGQGIFDNLVCDTAGSGSDLGVQNDLEVEGNIYCDTLVESTVGAGIIAESVKLKDGQVGLVDTDASHHLLLDAGSNLTADRVLSFVTGDAARTVTLNGNPTLADWFDQTVKVAASPTFVALSLTGNAGTDVIILDSDNGAGGVTRLRSASIFGDVTITFPGADSTLVGTGSVNVFTASNTFNATSHSLIAAEKISHSGDSNTYLRFTPDKMQFVCGGLELLTLIESAIGTDEIVVNEGNVDLNFRVEGNTDPNLLTCDAGNNNVTINAASVSVNYDLLLAGDGVLGLAETTTPTADATYGKVYTKSDNKLYFQSGDGVEHEVAYV